MTRRGSWGWPSAAIAWLLSACTQTIREEDLFHPERYAPVVDDQQRRSVAVAAADGAILRGWLLSSPEHRRSVLFFYGNAQTAKSAEAAAFWMSKALGCNVLTVDYRGYGANNGEPSFRPMLDDALRLHDALANELLPGVPVVCYGRSIGCVFATWVAAKRPVAGLVLGAPPTSAPDAVRAMGERIPRPFRWVFRLNVHESLTAPELQPIEVIRDVTAPVLIIHGERDEVVPFGHGERIHAAAAPPKHWLPLPGSGHNDWDVHDEPVASSLRSFLDTYTPD